MAVGSGSMRDARDAEDALLLEQGDYDLLVAAYAEVVVQRVAFVIERVNE